MGRMGLLTRSAEEETEHVEYAGTTWQYLARNLNKVAGISLENDFNKRGAEGWEFVAVADGYAIFKRPI